MEHTAADAGHDPGREVAGAGSDRDTIDDGRDETADERADRNWDELMQELRVMQTGTQVLTGFLLAVAFQPRFDDLDITQRALYLALVGMAALATVLALTPVGLHRSLFGQRRKPQLVRFAGAIARANLLVIGALTVGVLTLIVDFVVHRPAAVVVLLVSAIIVVLLWAALPKWVKRQ